MQDYEITYINRQDYDRYRLEELEARNGANNG